LAKKGIRPVWVTVMGLTVGLMGLSAGEQPEALQNFQEVNASLCRGAQPSENGLRELAKLGVHTVVDLRRGAGRSSKEAEVVRSLGMTYVNIPLDGYQAPTSQELSKVMAVLNDPNAGKVFVHCRRGADRTGTILAVYRMEHDHWSNQQALDEAKSMKMASSERLMQKFVLDFTPALLAAN
jgi:tyrosine-protein phosphatase SIW14